MFVAFPKIGGFHNVRKDVALFNDNGRLMKETYRGKIKLHGTNAGVQIKKKDVFAQSRERIITPGDDNMGFAGWVDRNLEYFKEFQVEISNHPMTIFGEWCGAGIMKGTAISGIGRKIFAVFAIQYGESDDFDSIMVTEPDRIRSILPHHDDIYVLPWATNAFNVDFSDVENMEENVAIMNKIVEGVEHQDPWVKEVFGVDGIGEGVVFVPYTADGHCSRWLYSKMTFKAKGDKHKVTNQKSAVQIDPEVAKSIDDFALMVTTDARLEQAARTISGGELVFDMKLIGPFLAWVGKDVEKESAAELEASGLEWKQVAKSVQRQAREWYVEKHNTI